MPTINGRACVVNGTPVDKVFSNGQQVYGRNLIRGSYDFSCTYNNNDATIQKVTMDSGEAALHVVGTKNWSGFNILVDFPSGNYTVSVDVKGTGIVNHIGWETISVASMTPTSDWQRVSRAGTLDGKQHALIFYGIMDVYVRLFKVEKGSVATPWTPAPEDVGAVVRSA